MMSRLTNASNGSTVSQMNVCLICERDCGQYVVYSRPTIGSSTPFFPILESLSNSTSSQVNCCRPCSQSLLEQWNEYEVKQIPIKNRFYYLNNNKLMINNKNDFYNTFNNKKQIEVNNSTNSKNTSEEVLDLSLASTSSSTQLKPIVRNDINIINNNNNVKYWTPNRYPQICYICGEESLTLVNVLVRPMANCPYFPSLVSHPKPINANPIDSNGRIGSCDSCHRFLIQQWEQFQRSNISIAERHYSFRPIISSINTRQRINRYSCALCSIELSHSMQNVVISMFTMNDTNSSMKKLILSSAQEFIISSGNNLETGRVLTCINCFRDLIKNNDNQQQYVSNHYSQNDSKKKSIIELNAINSNINSNNNEQEICALCNRVKTQLFLIDTNPSQLSLERKCFFPFLKDILKSHEIDSFGRVRVCNVCLSSLESQWDTFESALIPHTQRDYRLLSRRSPLQRTITPPPLKIQVSSPPPLQQSFISEPLLTTVTTQTHNTYCTTSSSIQYPNETETKILGPMDDMLSALGGPLHTSVNCVICGEYTMSGHTFQITSCPRVPPLINHELGIYPFFPILKKLISNNNNSNTNVDNCDERDDNRNNSGLVCTFCYHSLIGQWIAYNISPLHEDKDPNRRIYNCKEYICYICGVTTFRQRVRSITVKDFPFLLEHPRPAGALTVCNGESVVTCLTCFESLTHQWRDYERMKVPIEMRKYNWIIVPPPNRDSAPNETPLPLAHNLNESLSPSSLTTNASLLLGLGSHHKLPVLNASQISTTKSPSGVQRSMATVSPLYQVSAPPPPGGVAQIAVTHSNPANCHNVMSNSALAATRTSSFAAALRKLAKQSIDPLLCNDSGQQCSSLGLSVSHASNASKNSNSSFQSPYQSSIVGPSPPIVTIAPIPAHQIDRSNDVRKSENHIFYDHRIHSDQSKESLLFSHSQQRTSPIVQIRPSPSREHNESGQSSANNHTPQNGVQNRSSGFQPYRTSYEDSLRSNSSSSLTSAPLPSHLMPYETLTYPYHPFLPHTPAITTSAPLSHHIPHPSASYRLEDHFYLDRFSLLRGSLHGGSALSHTNSGSASTLPFNLSRYSELLNSQHDRIINDERQRLLNQTLSQSTYKSGVQTIDSPPLHLNIPTTSDRIIDTNSDHHLLNHLNHSVINNSSKRDYMLNSVSGSILSGTPRDHIHSSSSNSNRKSNAAPISASVKPLNLSSNSDHINSNSEQIYLWRPQSDEERERISSQNIQNYQNEKINDAINRKNNSFHIEESSQSKSLRNNSYENANSLIENRTNDKVIATTKFLPSEKNEGLHSRILENSERSLANDSIYSNHWQTNVFRPELINISPKSPLIEKEIEEQVISKLDLEEHKLKQKRLNKSFENQINSEEEDEEESEDNDEDNKYNIILTKRPPLELDTNPDKMQFLRTFNLTTHKRKSQLEFNKYIKRRKLLRELSPDSSSDKLDSFETFDDNKENPPIFNSSKILPDSIASQERNLEVKIHFMSTIGLREQISVEKQKDTELLWDGIIRDREMRSKRDKCWIKLINNLSKETIHKWLSNLQTKHCHSSYEIDINSHLSSNGFIQNGFTNSKFSNNLNSSRGQRKVILFNKQLNNDLKSSLSVENRSHSQHSSRDFAQEFHESVLLETTKQQQRAKHVRLDRHEHQFKSQEIQHKHYADLSSSSNYKWPGIEAVMEAYDRYSCDQKQENDFLQERTHDLKNRLQDINREAEYLSQKMADLIQTKSQLDDERQQYEKALDSLKKCLKQLR